MNEVVTRKVTQEDIERIDKTKHKKGFIGYQKKPPRKGDHRWPRARK
ncbi:hypothetical protein [Evansella clarkii]|nr:hypothetical protein [Evansella clarkii]